MQRATEPFTSLLQRELTILSKNFGQASRTIYELSRVLLRAREEHAMTSVNKGESGAESGDADPLPESASGPSLPQPALWEGFDESHED